MMQDEVTDALEQSGFDIEADPDPDPQPDAEKGCAQLAEHETRLNGTKIRLNGVESWTVSCDETLAVLTRRADWARDQLLARSDANQDRFPLLRDRITKDGPYIQVSTEADDHGRIRVYMGKAACDGETGQGYFLAWPQTLEPMPEARPPGFEAGSYKAGWHAHRDRSRRGGAIATVIIGLIAGICVLALT